MPRRVTLKYEFVEGGVKVTNGTLDAEGRSIVRTTTLKFDGKDYPYLNNVKRTQPQESESTTIRSRRYGRRAANLRSRRRFRYHRTPKL
jgi:hypothetical protein